MNEVEGLHQYVAALAVHDFHAETDIFTTAAFDLAVANTTEMEQCLQDQLTLNSIEQDNGHALCNQNMLWRDDLEHDTMDHLLNGADETLWHTAPPTILVDCKPSWLW